MTRTGSRPGRRERRTDITAAAKQMETLAYATNWSGGPPALHPGRRPLRRAGAERPGRPGPPGGKDSYAVDRAEAEQFLAIYPRLPLLLRHNRLFLACAVTWLARQGIR